MPMEPEASGRLVISYVSGCRGQIDTDAKNIFKMRRLAWCQPPLLHIAKEDKDYEI